MLNKGKIDKYCHDSVMQSVILCANRTSKTMEITKEWKTSLQVDLESESLQTGVQRASALLTPRHRTSHHHSKPAHPRPFPARPPSPYPQTPTY